MVGYIHLQHTAIAVEFARFGFLSKTIKNSNDHCDGYTRTFKPVLSAHSQTKTKTNKQTKKKTVDLSSNLCGITGVVWNP